MTLLVFYCFLISQNASSKKKWIHDYIKVSYNTNSRLLEITFLYYDYEFGLLGEHAYLQDCYFLYSPNMFNHYTFMWCHVAVHQLNNNSSWVLMKYKLPKAEMQFSGCEVPLNETIWSEDLDQMVKVKNINNKANLTIKWLVEPSIDIKKILVRGTWHVDGLNCADPIMESYIIGQNTPILHKEIRNESIQNKIFSINLTVNKNNAVTIYRKADTFIIKGADPGEKIQVYTTSGMLIYTSIVNQDVVKINLPLNQIYIVNVGQCRYKVVF